MQILIVYGTTEGQTRKIAQRMAERLSLNHQEVALQDATDLPDDLDLEAFDGILIAASVHLGRHQSAVTHFVKHHLPALAAKPTGFVSVSLAAASDDPEDLRDAWRCAEQFMTETGWRPGHTHLAEGAFRFTQYDFFKRWALKMIARRKGAPSDTDQDYEYTDWATLDRFVDGFLAQLEKP